MVELKVFGREDGTGTIDLDLLPCSMKHLNMLRNALDGTIKLSYLSGNMEARILLASRRFSVLAPTLLTVAARWWVRTSTVSRLRTQIEPADFVRTYPGGVYLVTMSFRIGKYSLYCRLSMPSSLCVVALLKIPCQHLLVLKKPLERKSETGKQQKTLLT